MLKRTLLCVLLATGLLILTVPGCGGGEVTKESFDKIEKGMTLAEVEKILGKGELKTGGSLNVGDVGGSTKVYTWVDGDKSITVNFVNDKVSLPPVGKGL